MHSDAGSADILQGIRGAMSKRRIPNPLYDGIRSLVLFGSPERRTGRRLVAGLYDYEIGRRIVERNSKARIALSMARNRPRAATG